MSSSNGFLGRVRKKLEDLNLKETELQEQLATVTAARDRYEAAWEIYRQEMNEGAVTEDAPPGRLTDEELAGMKIADAAMALLKEAGGKIRMADLVRRLRRAGTTKAKGTGAYSSVLKTLQRTSGVEQIGRGMWALQEMTAKSS